MPFPDEPTCNQLLFNCTVRHHQLNERHLVLMHTEAYFCDTLELQLDDSLIGANCHRTVVPEPDFFPAIMVGILLIGALSERARSRRSNRAVFSVWLKKQCEEVRGWIRKVFRKPMRLVRTSRSSS